MSRATTAYVGDYSLDRPVSIRMSRGQSRVLLANFNGAMAVGATIIASGATWRVTNNSSLLIASAVVSADRRSTQVQLTAQYGGGGLVKVSVTTSLGNVLTQVFDVSVVSQPWFSGEPTIVTGPTVLVAV